MTRASTTPASGRTEQSQVWNCLRCALLAALAVLLWQFLTVKFNYRGNWTALFCTGESTPLPPELASGTYRFQGSIGYDGQFYRYVAHDPWMRKGYWRHLDDARLRYRRILVPAAAWLLAGGQPRFIDAAYAAVILLWVFLGAYWLSRYACSHDRHPAWGLGFLLVPATLVSIDRFTVDVALAALCAGFVWYARRDSPSRLYVILALAPLVRDTGLLLVSAACLHALWQRRWRRAFLFATAALPALLWFGLVQSQPMRSTVGGRMHHLFTWLFRYPLAGIVMKMFRPEYYPLGPVALQVARACDLLALAGVLLAVGMALWRLLQRRIDMETIAALMFVGLVATVSTPSYWGECYGYARTTSPLLLLVALPAVAGGSLWWLLPALLVDLRVGIQFAPQALGVLRGIF